jgi:hypothetical protein
LVDESPPAWAPDALGSLPGLFRLAQRFVCAAAAASRAQWDDPDLAAAVRTHFAAAGQFSRSVLEGVDLDQVAADLVRSATRLKASGPVTPPPVVAWTDLGWFVCLLGEIERLPKGYARGAPLPPPSVLPGANGPTGQPATGANRPARARGDEADRSVHQDGKYVVREVELPVFRFFEVIAEAYPDPIPFSKIQTLASGLHGKHPTRDLKDRLPAPLAGWVKSGKHGYRLELPAPKEFTTVSTSCTDRVRTRRIPFIESQLMRGGEPCPILFIRPTTCRRCWPRSSLGRGLLWQPPAGCSPPTAARGRSPHQRSSAGSPVGRGRRAGRW